jgi:hypothetical protein
MTTPVKEQAAMSPPDRVVHLSPRADEVDTLGRTVKRLASPQTFPQVVALVLLIGVGIGAYFLGVRFTDALDRNTAALAKLTDAVVQHEIAATMREQVARERR